MDDKYRVLPRHVDGRIMIGLIPFKKFLIMLPFDIIIIIIMLKFFSPVIFFICIISIGVLAALFSEIANRESGFDVLKDMIRYQIEGDKYFERSCIDEPAYKRCIRLEIKAKHK